MMKKLISLLLVVCMLAACCGTVFAADTAAEQKADALFLMGLFKGTDQGYELDNPTTREQGVTMLIRLLGKETEANSGKYACSFTDVYDWAKGIVGYAFDKGITKGMSDTKFGYGVALTDAMFLTMLLRIIGYTEGADVSADFVWSDPYALAAKIGLVASATADADFDRGDMVQIIYNALDVKYKGESKTVAQKLMDEGVLNQLAYDFGQQVASGSTTLEDAQALLAIALGGGGSSGGNTSGGGGYDVPATPDPDPGFGGDGSVTTPEDTTQADHETPDIEF